MHNQLNNKECEQFDLLLTIDDGGHTILPSFNITKAIWIIDTHVSFNYDILILLDYDFIFCAQQEVINKLESYGFKNVYWLPLACDPDIHSCTSFIEKKYSVGFVGNSGTQDRENLLQKLRDKYLDSYIGKAKLEEMACIYASSQVAFNKSIKNDLNMRFFEAVCSGTPLVTDFLPDIEDLELGKYVTYYKCDEEIDNAINSVFFDIDRKKKLALKGKIAVMQNHSYSSRIKQLFNIIQNNSKIEHNLKFPFNFLQKLKIIRKMFLNRYLNLVILYIVDPHFFKLIIIKKFRKG